MPNDNSHSESTRDHEKIKQWADQRGAKPATVKGAEGMLRFEFDSNDQNLEPISWDDFFKIFDERGLELVFDSDPDSRFAKFVYPEDEK